MQTTQIPSGSSLGQPQTLGNKKVQLKLAMPHAIKKVRNLPQTADDLMQLIKGNMQADAQNFAVEYEDTDGDQITITDDDDLLLAYEQAQESANGNLKLLITKKEPKLAVDAQVAKAPDQNQDDDQMSSSSSDSDDEKTDDFVMVQPKKQKKCKGNKDGQNKDQKKQRKMMKKIIRQTIKHQTKELMQSIKHQNFEQIADSSAQPVSGSAQKQGQSDPTVLITSFDEKAFGKDSPNPGPAMNQMMRQLGLTTSGGFVSDQQDQPPPMPVNSMDDKEAWNAWGQQMKQWGLRMQQKGAGHGWNGQFYGPGPRGGPWRRNFNHMQFGNQFDQGFNQQNWQGFGNGFRPQAWEGTGGHKVNRGRVIKSPKDCVVAIPSKTVYVQIEMRNNTHWPYKPGCQFASLFNADLKAAVEDVKLPVEQIMAMTNFTISIPLKIKDSAVPCELSEKNKDFYVAMFSLQGPKGFSFGETVSIKLRIIKELEDVEIYTRVMQLIESNPQGNYDFEEAVAAYKDTGYDGKKALEFIDKKKAEKVKNVLQDNYIHESTKKDDEMKDGETNA